MIYKVFGKSDCPYCVKAKELLDSKGLQYVYADVQESSSTLEGMQNLVSYLTGGRAKTVPQIIKIEGDDVSYVGGYDSLVASFKEQLQADDFNF